MSIEINFACSCNDHFNVVLIVGQIEINGSISLFIHSLNLQIIPQAKRCLQSCVLKICFQKLFCKFSVKPNKLNIKFLQKSKLIRDVFHQRNKGGHILGLLLNCETKSASAILKAVFLPCIGVWASLMTYSEVIMHYLC